MPRAGRADPFSELSAGVRVITGQPLAATAREHFARYLDLLLEWNRAHRLTGFSSAADIVQKLFLDSVLFLPVLPPRPLTVADIGTGPGIPGVPLRILDGRISLTLIESKRRAISFLSALKRDLALEDVRVLHTRAEAVTSEATDLQGVFDVVVSRAVGRTTAVVSAVRQLLKPGGVFIVSGPPQAISAAPMAPEGFSLSVRQVRYSQLGLSRQFLVATRQT